VLGGRFCAVGCGHRTSGTPARSALGFRNLTTYIARSLLETGGFSPLPAPSIVKSPIAEQRGDVTPDGLQHLLARARWDADAVRDDLRPGEQNT
jgi:hypothetical protein